MSRKKTIEEVRELVESKNLTLLSKEYTDSFSELKYKCNTCNKLGSSNYKSLKRSKFGCSFCGRKAVENSVRTDIETVKLAFSSRGLIADIDSYTDCRVKYPFECSRCGYKSSIDYFTIKKSLYGCKACGAKHRGKERKLSIDYVKESLDFLDLEFISMSYENNAPIIGYKCKRCSHEGETQWGCILKSLKNKKSFPETKFNGCVKCRNAHMGVSKRRNEADIKDMLAKENYRLLSDYTSVNTVVKILCPNGHIWPTKINTWDNGGRCIYCAKKKVDPKDVELAFASEGYKLLSKYVKNNIKLDFECTAGHKHSITWSDWQDGCRCRYCANSGFKRDKPAILYYVKFNPIGCDPFYKIGITNNTVARRFDSEPMPYVVLKVENFEIGYDAEKKEQEILRQHEKFKLNKKLLTTGNTECFNSDVLELDR